MQSEDRLHRPPQKNNVTYIDLVTVDTCEKNVVEALRAKENLSVAVLDKLRALLRQS